MRSLLGGLRVRVTRLFFANFFRLLLVVISTGQWVCAAWVLTLAGQVSLPPWVHLAGAGGLYALNLSLILRRRRRAVHAPGVAMRVYSATAFVSVFCFAFFLAGAGLWMTMRGVLGALSAQAGTTAGLALVDTGLDGTFRWFISLGMAGIALTFAYGYLRGHRQLRVTRLGLTVPGVPPAAAGLRIAHISDLHVGPNLTLAELRCFVDRVNALEPDLICLTGDIADSPFADCARFFPVLGELRARHGVCAILGNHDHYAGAERVVAALRRWTPFRVLRDEAVTLGLNGLRLHVIGLDDRGRDWARGVVSDARLAELVAAAPADALILLLSHRPDIFPQAAAAGVAVTLAGHTHGGQLALPWFGGRRRNLAEFITPYDRGLYEANGCHLYVSCGLGVTGQRIRLFTPREIGLVELRTRGAAGPPA